MTPTNVANLALDAVGRNIELGNIEEGGREANLCLRAYGKCRRDLLRGAPWAFARRQVPLNLLADASGGTPNVSNQVPGTIFQFSYAYPQDCARIRYIPWNPFQNVAAPAGNIVPANASSPLTTGSQPTQLWQPIRPSLYVVTNDPNMAVQPGPFGTTQHGTSPQGSTVILSNVQSASCVFTFDAVYPSLWDGLFMSAMIAYMASEVALPLWSNDIKSGATIRAQQIAITKNKIAEARVANGNEMTVSVDHQASWMSARYTGSRGGYNGSWGGGGDWGCWGMGWGGSVGFADGSAY